MPKVFNQKSQSEGNVFEDKWLEKVSQEGELKIDVYDAGKNIIVKSAIAGVKPDDLDISVSRDMLTIKGNRESEEKVPSVNYFHQECYWGKFSRSVILPSEIKSGKIKAFLKNGILTIVLPKEIQKTMDKIKIQEVEN